MQALRLKGPSKENISWVLVQLSWVYILERLMDIYVYKYKRYLKYKNMLISSVQIPYIRRGYADIFCKYI